MAKKSIFEVEKSLKLPKMQFDEKNIDLYDFTSFFDLDYFKFSGPLCNKKLRNLTNKNTYNCLSFVVPYPRDQPRFEFLLLKSVVEKIADFCL